jgi:hypothetical protein
MDDGRCGAEVFLRLLPAGHLRLSADTTVSVRATPTVSYLVMPANA